MALAWIFGLRPAPIEPQDRGKESAMVPQTVENRVESLEQKVGALEELPAQVTSLGSQILQFRERVHVEFSAIRAEIQAGDN